MLKEALAVTTDMAGEIDRLKTALVAIAAIDHSYRAARLAREALACQCGAALRDDRESQASS